MSALQNALASPKARDLLSAWGAPYAWGVGSPGTGWPPVSCDCSGFVQAALVRLGRLKATAPDRASAALAEACTVVSADSDHALGDLAFYGSLGKVSHVMLILGAGVVLGAHGGGSKTHGDDPTAYVGIECLHYRRDLIFVGRLKGT